MSTQKLGALSCAVLLSASLAAAAPASELFAVRAERIELGDGTTVEDGVLMIEGGRIRAVGRGVEIPPEAQVILHDGVITAGMVAFQSRSGSASDAYDSSRSFLPEARMVDSFQPSYGGFERLSAAGITSVVLAPFPNAICPGVTAVVKTAGGRVVNDEAHLFLSMSRGSLVSTREPTSYSGAVSELGARMDQPEGAFAQAASGSLPVLARVGARHEILRAVDFFERHGLRGTLVGGPLAGELAGRIAGAGLGVAVGPFQPGTSTRARKSVVSLAEAGVPLAFSLEDPARSPESLRLGVALCVRGGLDPIAAWKGLTADAARLAGVGDTTGRLERGMDADFVLWSGAPLDLSSSVVAVYIDGVQVAGGER